MFTQANRALERLLLFGFNSGVTKRDGISISSPGLKKEGREMLLSS
jgi:hypothetical protein